MTSLGRPAPPSKSASPCSIDGHALEQGHASGGRSRGSRPCLASGQHQQGSRPHGDGLCALTVAVAADVGRPVRRTAQRVVAPRGVGDERREHPPLVAQQQRAGAEVRLPLHLDGVGDVEPLPGIEGVEQQRGGRRRRREIGQADLRAACDDACACSRRRRRSRPTRRRPGRCPAVGRRRRGAGTVGIASTRRPAWDRAWSRAPWWWRWRSGFVLDNRSAPSGRCIGGVDGGVGSGGSIGGVEGKFNNASKSLEECPQARHRSRFAGVGHIAFTTR